MIYEGTLLVHSWLRWIVLLALFVRVGMALAARSRGSDYDRRARLSAAATVGGLDLMTVLGVVLLSWLSPLTTAAMSDMGSAMGDPVRRFWLVEHPTTMFLAVAAAHVGSSIAKRATDARRAHTAVALGLSLAILLLLAGIPWPFRPGIGRPLFAL